jgi:signal transduction histidine kinase
LTIAGLLVGYVTERDLRKDVLNQLLTTAGSKAKQIETYVQQREREVTTLSRTPTVIAAMEKLVLVFQKPRDLNSPEYLALENRYRPYLTHYTQTTGCKDLFLISPNGDAVFSMMKGEDLGSNYKTGIYRDSELAKVFDRASTLLETQMSDFGYYQATNQPAAFIAAPVIRDGTVLGVVALQMSNEEIYELAQDYTGLGETGETIIGHREEDRVVFLTPVRHDPHADFRRRILMGADLARPLQQAVRGKKGQGIAIDYRSQEVLATWRYLPHCRWGMVVKIDSQEAFAPIVRLRNQSVTIGAIVILVVVLVALIVSHSISKPITQLAQATRIITGGDLTRRAEVKSADEIGELAHEFNTMVERVGEQTEEMRALNLTLEQRVAERTEELSRTTDRLARSNTDLEQFAYVASHDLQEPLRAMSGFCQLLQRRYQGKLDATADDYIQEVVAGAERMQRLIVDLLDYSRVGRKGKPFEPTDCTAIIEQTLARLHASIEETDAQVRYDGLPTVNGDPLQLAQVFQNLISNAVKFRGDRTPEIHISAEPRADEWLFSVRDRGIGIDPKFKERIFVIFQRLHTREQYPGTGIGLAICKRIIERHGGRMWLESQPGHGSNFLFTIPM